MDGMVAGKGSKEGVAFLVDYIDTIVAGKGLKKE